MKAPISPHALHVFNVCNQKVITRWKRLVDRRALRRFYGEHTK